MYDKIYRPDILKSVWLRVKENKGSAGIIPAQVKVVEHVRHVYICRACEQEGITTPVITAPMPAPVLPGSFVSPSFMVFVINRKYREGLRLYRQEQQLRHFGWDISRQTMANWMIRGAHD
ncbi:zinc-finger binding domain of transposase IS66 [Anoxynatronum buryatiense]|uniref:Zinc-finger binding domain of transposase IS66 n=1 Tax=Anoxynatronum buryatiense TaxID=489973 RepID=A0AA46AK60_9CLOT|nr:zinc-finger binding domain of transposase IS66 [Anoxynatronum buryatiense]